MFSCAYEDVFRLLCNAYSSLLPILLKIGLSDFFLLIFITTFCIILHVLYSSPVVDLWLQSLPLPFCEYFNGVLSVVSFDEQRALNLNGCHFSLRISLPSSLHAFCALFKQSLPPPSS